MQIRSNGRTLSCRVEGEEGAPWVTLAHALATDLRLWDPLVPSLAGRYRVLRFDAPGHGGSEPPDEGWSLAGMGDDVIGLLDALGIEKTHFVGLSMGGMAGLGLALDHAERLLSCTVCDARDSATPAYRESWAQRIALVERQGIEAIVEPSVSRWFAPNCAARRPEVIEAARAMVRGTAPTGYRRAGLALCDLAYGARLAEIAVPMLYIVGLEDQGAPPEVMRAMQAATPGARFAGLSDAGHLSVLEQPEAFAAALLQFLDDVEAGTP